jgi:hypothetical protein
MQDGTTIGTQEKQRQAVVISAGIAGLLATRVLAEYYEQVLVVDGLVISPREVINARMLATLLAVGEASEERQLLAELLQGYPQHFEALLDEIIPDFSRAFEGLQTFAQEEEVSVSRGV